MKAETIVKRAVTFIGTKESPANSNNVIFNTHYYGKKVSGSAYPWCCAFVWDIFQLCGASELFYDGKKTAYCPSVEIWGKQKGLTVAKTAGKPGDIVLFDFYGKNIACHIGIIEKKNADGTYTVIEGNTSISSNDNGGAVMRRTRSTSVIRCIIRPKYEADKSATTSSHRTIKKGSSGKAVKLAQKTLIKLGYSCGPSGADGDFGQDTEKAVKRFQKAKRLAVDGIVGPLTWNALVV